MSEPARTKREEWRLLETFDVPARFAMGLDEALLLDESAPPTLRLYSWAPEALSLGYFQAFEDVPCAAAHHCVVRRLTGGGAIQHHAQELTFSVTLPASHPAYRGTIPDSYARTHRAIAAALDSVGVQHVAPRDERTCASDMEGTGMCFHDSTPMDLCWPGEDGRLAKGVGTAQRRKGGRILHHGSIKLDRASLEPRIAHARGLVSLRTMADALIDSIEREYEVALSLAAPTRAQVAQAQRLGPRYQSPTFLHRKTRRPK